jgi:hypothetical protein
METRTQFGSSLAWMFCGALGLVACSGTEPDPLEDPSATDRPTSPNTPTTDVDRDAAAARDTSPETAAEPGDASTATDAKTDAAVACVPSCAGAAAGACELISFTGNQPPAGWDKFGSGGTLVNGALEIAATKGAYYQRLFPQVPSWDFTVGFRITTHGTPAAGTPRIRLPLILSDANADMIALYIDQPTGHVLVCNKTSDCVAAAGPNLFDQVPHTIVLRGSIAPTVPYVQNLSLTIDCGTPTPMALPGGKRFSTPAVPKKQFLAMLGAVENSAVALTFDDLMFSR